MSGMTRTNDRRIYILLGDWTWWAWTLTAVLLIMGLFGLSGAFVGAIGLTGLQAIVMLIREKSLSAFPVQLRLAYLLLMGICYLPHMRWLYWVPAIGTLVLVIFGYCMMARVLSLFSWNRREPISADLLRRTFGSRPDLSRLAGDEKAAGCAGGLCTIDVQIRPSTFRMK
jgi:hypothetical protein